MIEMPFVVRPATLADAETLFAWRNDPSTRAMARSRRKVEWDEHHRWLHARLAQDNPALFIVELRAEPVATYRLDDRSISYTVAPQHRGKGIASALLERAVRDWGPLHAKVYSSNVASRKAAEAAGLIVEIIDRIYCIAGIQPSSMPTVKDRIAKLPGRWHFLLEPGDLSLERLSRLKPDAVFFVYCNWRIPDDVIDAYECVAFRASESPLGWDGNPLQKLIDRGVRQTKISALRVTKGIDGGPVYIAKDLSLVGHAHEISNRADNVVVDIIEEMITDWPDLESRQQ